MLRNNVKFKITIGVSLIIFGIMMLSANYVREKREEIFSSMNLALSDISDNKMEENTESIQNEEENKQEEEEKTSDDTETDYETYLGILEIPKIDFYKGFYDKNSKLNNVKFNLKFIDASSYPTEDRGNVIIIGHSGNYSNSYFGNLYKLNVNDTASVYYKNRKYNYKIVNIYNEEKDGTVTIYRDIRKNCLTLITCTKDDDYHQTVYIFELVNTE